MDRRKNLKELLGGFEMIFLQVYSLNALCIRLDFFI